ncbi:MAG TPA: HAMP domain-containing sensor histidine kinase [Pseudonocardiaceae bacterium]|nr:HAMP domain-containing sensor histidine kinase [Pseudonocardiaceae bacterium]
MKWLRAFVAPFRGLRLRLLLGFAGLCVLTAALVAGGMYVLARREILQQSQDASVASLTRQIATIYPLRTLPPTKQSMTDIADQLTTRGNDVRVEYQKMSVGDLSGSTITADLREVIGNGHMAWQRVDYDGTPALIVGTEIMVTEPGQSVRPSGVDVFAGYQLLAEEASISQISDIAWGIGALALLLAMLLGIVVARSVLGPVRELRTAAVRLGAGELSSRVPVHGSDELAEVARTFNNTAQSLAEHVAELRRMEADARRFVADVSHELRTPLAAMIAVLDVLDDQASHLPEPTGEAVRLVSQGTHNLTRLVNDLIEVTRFDSGTAALALDHIDLAVAIRATLRARGWTDAVDTDLPDGIMARVDPRRLDVIVANLVGNALRHGAPPVSIRLTAEPGWRIIEVADNGPGLAADVLPQVFNRFYKADTARARSEGSGLGLAIAWENARLHRTDDRVAARAADRVGDRAGDRAGDRVGSLVAANRPGGGAVFTLRLPTVEEPS